MKLVSLATKSFPKRSTIVLGSFLLAACGGGGGGGSPPPPAQASVKYMVSGVIATAIPEGVLLDDGNGNTVKLAPGDELFKFRDGQSYLGAGTFYNVTVKAQPKGYTCSVDNPYAKAESNTANPGTYTMALRCKGPLTNRVYVDYTGKRDGSFGLKSLAFGKDGDYFTTVEFELFRVEANGKMHNLTLLDHASGAPVTDLTVRNIAVGSTGQIYLSVQRNSNETIILKLSKTATEDTYLVDTLAESFVDSQNQSKYFGISVGMSIDSADNLYVADRNYNVIWKISSAGVVTTFAGSGVAGNADGTGTAATFQFTGYIATLSHDGAGNLYVHGDVDKIVRKISPAGLVTSISVPDGYYKGVSDEAGNLYFVSMTSSGVPSIFRISSTGVTDLLVSRGTVTFDNEPNGLRPNAIGYVQVMRVSNGFIYIAGWQPMAIYKIKI